MKCQKCSKSAVVHLTEVVGDSSGQKKAVEIHLCLGHAVEAGLIVPGSEILPQIMTGLKKLSPPATPAMGKPVPQETGGAIVPAPPTPPEGLAVVRTSTPTADPLICPICGTTWSQFKQTGLMGCGHDYEMYEVRLLPLLKRAQEGGMEHMGKVPPKKKTEETDRQVTSLRLRRELQKAIDAENYEQAARLRDQLRTLEKN